MAKTWFWARAKPQDVWTFRNHPTLTEPGDPEHMLFRLSKPGDPHVVGWVIVNLNTGEIEFGEPGGDESSHEPSPRT